MDKQAYLAQIDRVIAAGPYKADWSSLSRHATPGWYQDAKLGIFIHWDLQCARLPQRVVFQSDV